MFSDNKIQDVQSHMQGQGLDGWLLYDFRRCNDLAMDFLEIPESTFFSRRFFYWIPSVGTPMKIVHAIESENLDHLPGEKLIFLSWNELEGALAAILAPAAKIIMEYSPRNANPYVSKVDAGTMDLVRSFGVEVESSGDLLQRYTSVWDEQKMQSHFEAAEVLDKTVEKAWHLVASSLRENKSLSEYEIQQFILQEFDKNDCCSNETPIVAFNEHAADPHYMPTKDRHSFLKEGDFVLIDLWCKKNHKDATYADITRVGVAANEATEKQKEIFSIVKRARDSATDMVKDYFRKGEPLMGWQVDAECRRVIEEAGYGQYFTHRTGHNIDTNDHGNGANIDNLETQDRRYILPGTCFSIEPGIYLSGDFGVRLEYDIFIGHDSTVNITGGIQEELVCALQLPHSEEVSG